MTKKEKKNRALDMKANPTPSERRMRDLLHQEFPRMFATQVVKRGYILDFFSAYLGIAVEVDGSSHSGRERHDRRRDTVMFTHGIRTVRFDADSLYREGAGEIVADRIREVMLLREEQKEEERERRSRMPACLVYSPEGAA
jgi:very-short-patch-repair endonuclease